MQLCSYYQAIVSRPDTWFLTSVLRSFEHIVFDRTLDAEAGLFEFFVPMTTEKYFLEIMREFVEKGIVSELKKLPNRLEFNEMF